MGIKYSVNSNFFKTWSTEMAYVLGFVAADGSLEDASYLRGKYLRICSNDLEIIEKIKTAMYSEHTIVKINPKEFVFRGRKYIAKEKYMLRIGDHKIYNDLVEMGITPKKSRTINLPKIPLDYAKDFFRGYLDGDGCISFYKRKNRLSVTFTSGSPIFLKQLAGKISALVGVKNHNVLTNNRAFQIKYSTKEAVPLLAHIYFNTANVLYLERKYLTFLKFIQLNHKLQSNIYGVVPKWLRELSAKQLFTGSSPVHASH